MTLKTNNVANYLYSNLPVSQHTRGVYLSSHWACVWLLLLFSELRLLFSEGVTAVIGPFLSHDTC